PILFFTLLPPALCAMLFPYTTLFRSIGLGAVRVEVVLAVEHTPLRDRTVQRQPDLDRLLDRPLVDHRQHARVAQAERAGERVGLDRKSIRLNSSHVAISYAVFCLKKK